MKVEMIPKDKQISHANMLIKLSNAKAYLVENRLSYETIWKYSGNPFALFFLLFSEWKTCKDASSGFFSDSRHC